MATVLNPPQLAGEERFVLRNVTWETYEQLLKNYESFSAPRLTYDAGDLEIMSPPIQEDQYIAVSHSIVLPGVAAEAVTRFVNESGSMKRPEWLRGVRQWIRSIDEVRDR